MALNVDRVRGEKFPGLGVVEKEGSFEGVKLNAPTIAILLKRV